MTAAERINAATIIQFTTVRPFSFMGSSYKCFYCQQYHPDVPSVLDHTTSHAIEDRDTIINKYIPRGKRTFVIVDISNLACRICNKQYKDLNSVKEHLKRDHDKEFFGVSNGITEFNLETVDGMFICHICRQEFHSFSLLNSHISCHVGKVVCENCGARFLSQYLLNKHNETHGITKYNCKKCNQEFTKKSQLKYHRQRIHDKKEVKEMKCVHCSQTFKEHYSKVVHMKEAHGISRTFRCHICHVQFSLRRTLTEHITKCHTEKYKCEICSKCFGIGFKLKVHLKTHTEERNFSCPICKNAYKQQVTLKRHMQSVHSSS